MILNSLLFCLAAFVLLIIISFIVAALIKLIAFVIQRKAKPEAVDGEAGYSA